MLPTELYTKQEERRMAKSKILLLYASVSYVAPKPQVSTTSISNCSLPSDLRVQRHIHSPLVHELMVGDTLKLLFFSKTLFKNKLFPVRYFPTIVRIPRGFFISRKNCFVYYGTSNTLSLSLMSWRGGKLTSDIQIITLINLLISQHHQILNMSERINNIKRQICTDPVDFLNLKSLLPPMHIPLLQRLEQFGSKHLTTQKFYDHYDQCLFPDYLIPHLQELEIGKYFIPKPYGEELPLLVQGMLIATIAQYDLSLSTFLFLQLPLVGRTIYKLGSQQQKQKFLPELISLHKIWGWALTEREVGSNSTRINTTFAKDSQGLILSGNKRWIGNGNRDYLVVYGKLLGNQKQSPIVAGIVDMKLKGVTSNVIKNKLSLRIVQNCQIQFENVKLHPSSLLPGATNYKVGVQDILKHSRVIVIWNAIGGCIGVYKNALRYCLQRKQFGRPIAGFQIIQQKLVRIMGNLQAILLAGWRITELYEKDTSLSTGKIGMFKAWVTERARLICSLGRQIMGGNGLLQQNYVMKALIDMETLYTYEGTYEMNSLVAGFELTGLKAFV